MIVQAGEAVGTGQLAHFPVQAGIVDGHAGKGGQHRKHVQLFGGKNPRSEIIEIKDADDFLLHLERYRHQAANPLLQQQGIGAQGAVGAILQHLNLPIGQKAVGQAPELDLPAIMGDEGGAQSGMGMQGQLAAFLFVQGDASGRHVQNGHGAAENILQHLVQIQGGDHHLGDAEKTAQILELALECGRLLAGGV